MGSLKGPALEVLNQLLASKYTSYSDVTAALERGIQASAPNSGGGSGGSGKESRTGVYSVE